MMKYNCPYCDKEYSLTKKGVVDLYEYCTCGELFRRTYPIWVAPLEDCAHIKITRIDHALVFKSSMETKYSPEDLAIVSTRKIEFMPEYSCPCLICKNNLKEWLTTCSDPLLEISDDYLPTYSGLFLLTLDHYEDHTEDEWEAITITDWRKS